MSTRLIYLLLSGIFLAAFAPIFAIEQEPPKLLLIGYHSHDPQTFATHSYVGPSLDAAILKEFQANFVFQLLSPSVWQRTAADNHIYPVDYHTKTVALNLGLLSKQDIVISGWFTAKEEKILVETRIYDIRQVREIKAISSVMPVTSQIFAETEKLVAEISQQASSILPNKQNWQRRYAQIQRDALQFNSIAIEAGAGLGMSRSPTTALTPETLFGPAIFPLLFNARVNYLRHRIILEDLFFMASAVFSSGNTSFAAAYGQGRSTTTEAMALGGFGYHFILSARANTYLRAVLGAGYMFHQMEADYSSIFPRPIDAVTGKGIDAQSFTYRSVIAELSFPLGLSVIPQVSVELIPRFQTIFLSNQLSFRTAFSVAAIISF